MSIAAAAIVIPAPKYIDFTALLMYSVLSILLLSPREYSPSFANAMPKAPAITLIVQPALGLEVFP